MVCKQLIIPELILSLLSMIYLSIHACIHLSFYILACGEEKSTVKNGVETMQRQERSSIRLRLAKSTKTLSVVIAMALHWLANARPDIREDRDHLVD